MTLTDQVMSRIATLTDEEITTLNALTLPIPEIVAADNAVGAEASLVMAQVPENVDAGVYAVARVAVLGILAKDDTLIRVWTDVVGPFEDHPLLSLDGETGVITHAETGIVVGQAPTMEENIATLSAPETPAEAVTVGETPIEAQTVVETPALVDAPLDIQEGEINT